MTKWITVAFISGVLLQTGCMQKKNSLAVLKEKIIAGLAIDKAQFGIVYKNLQTGETILLNEKENFHAASTMKTPVLIELLRQAKRRKFSLTDSVVIKNSFHSIVDGSTYSLKSLSCIKISGRKGQFHRWLMK
jgi:beta-lactamase class A